MVHPQNILPLVILLLRDSIPMVRKMVLETRSGDITEEGKYITGLKMACGKSFYSNGKLKFKVNFVQGNPDGQQLFYYEDGKTKEEQYFQMGIRQKTWKKSVRKEQWFW